jgi:hypothetical protein
VTEDPERSPDTESAEVAEVRRLLAEVRHTEPMPDDVADRMAGVIAGLADETPETGETPGTPTVISIAAHRRRRAAALLVAAAAIVVGGVTLAPHVHLSSNGGSAATPGAASDAGGSTDHGNTGQSQNGDQATPGTQSQLGEAKAPDLRGGRLVVRPSEFSAAALQGRALLAHHRGLDVHLVRTCSGLPAKATAVSAEYQHASAALVYRRPEGSTQVVDLYVCGSDRPVRSTTLPAP